MECSLAKSAMGRLRYSFISLSVPFFCIGCPAAKGSESLAQSKTFGQTLRSRSQADRPLWSVPRKQFSSLLMVALPGQLNLTRLLRWRQVLPIKKKWVAHRFSNRDSAQPGYEGEIS